MRPARMVARMALAAAALSSAACQSPAYETNWNRLRAGMDHAEVEALLGRPSSTYAPPPPDAAERERPSAVPMERWQFGDTLSSMATRAMFPDEADERAWCVFFGADGRVSGFRPPAWATGHRSMEPQALGDAVRARATPAE
ncbi:MAG: hypothetical protein ACKOEL_05765 [Planctomycetota bacterium]